jgi:hypothetical protein
LTKALGASYYTYMSKVTTVCMVCSTVLVQGVPGAPLSHGVGICCWASYRASLGLKVKPFPVAA